MPRPAALAALFAAAALLAPGLARADVVVDGSHRTALYDCNNEPVVVNGSDNSLVFHGTCESLRVNGSHNQVEIDLQPGAALKLAGSFNHVLYRPIVPGPTVALVGSDNSAAAGTFGAASAALAPPVPPAAPPPPSFARTGRLPGSLLLPGDNVAATVACAGRNVVIEGSGNRYTLRGGCRSVTVQGHDNVVQAQLQPGSRIAIAGEGDTLHYTLTGPGPLPVISVTGATSRAMTAATQ